MMRICASVASVLGLLPGIAHSGDESGAVFTVKAGLPNVWINTIYDLEQGHVQYACFVGEAMVTLIDIHLRKLTPESTGAEVAYERTAVRPEANDEVNRLAEHDRTKGAEWEAALRTYLHVGEGVSVNHD